MKKLLNIILPLGLLIFMMVGCSLNLQKQPLTSEYLLGKWEDPTSLIELREDKTFTWNIKGSLVNMYGDYLYTDDTLTFHITKLSQVGTPTTFEDGTTEDTEIFIVKEITDNSITLYDEEDDILSVIKRVK